MAVRLKRPWSGQGIGTRYVGGDEDYLVQTGMASVESTSSALVTLSATTSHTAGPRDSGRTLNFVNANPITIRLAADTAPLLENGLVGTYYQGGVGQITVAADSGLTLVSSGATSKSAGIGSAIQVQKTDAKTFNVLGSLAAS